MRGNRMWLVIAAAAGLAGCGDRRVVFQVDVLSYLDASQREFPFGPIPPAPGGFATGEQPVVQDQTVHLLGGASSVAEVQSVSIASTTVSTTSSGSGLDTLRLYLSDESTDPMMTSPVMVLPLQLVAGSTDTTHVDISGDQRVADLFMGQRLRMALTTSYRGPSSGSDLNGVISVVQIDAVVIAGRKPY